MGLFGTWHEAAKVAEFADSDRKKVVLAGKEIAIFKVDGTFFAVADVCTHARALMVGGLLEGHEIECPLHGARFDVRDGRVLTPPAVKGLATYAVRVEGDAVLVKV